MNGFVPVLVAVLLGELGQRGALSYKTKQDAAVWAGMAAIFLAASVTGQLMAERMTDWAGALMIAVALALAASGQLVRAKARASAIGLLWGFWSGSAPLLTFAFATRFGPWASALGALTGTFVAAGTTALATRNAMPLRIARLLAAIVLLGSAAVVAVNALRLV